MADPAKKHALIVALQESRGQIAGNIAGIRRDFSVGRRFRRSVRQHPAVWYAGAALVGLLLAKLPSMGKKVIVPQPVISSSNKSAGKAAFGLAALKIMLDLGKPMIGMWMRDRLSHGPPTRRPSRQRESAFSR